MTNSTRYSLYSLAIRHSFFEMVCDIMHECIWVLRHPQKMGGDSDESGARIHRHGVSFGLRL